MRKMPKVLAGIFVTAVALGLAGCSGSATNQSSQNNRPKTSKVEKKTAGVKKSNKTNKTHKDTKTISNQKSNKPNDNNQGTNTNKPNKASSQLSNADKAALAQERKQNNNGVNLGNGITGSVDRGAGQVYISFKANGKNYTVHGNDVQSNANAVDKAKQVAQNPNKFSNNGIISADGTK